jgi:hypothetical protein
MFTLFGIISLVVCVVGWSIISRRENVGAPMAIFGTGFLIVCLLGAIIMGIDVRDSVYIDEKILMYETENASIQEQVESVVNAYVAYEHKTFTDIANKSPIALVSVFPELKSDAVMAKQIDLYVNNNNKIKDLMLDKIDYKSKKWWLYFGG